MSDVVRIGCSGWQYRHWRGSFYPAGLPAARWFAHYALTFDTVEINSSFYRLPEASTFAQWREQAPPHFLYAVKASRFLTHMKKLKDPADPLKRFFDNAKQLKTRLGPVLFQLPPGWHIDVERLRAFLEELATHHVRSTIEFRDPSWYDDRIYTLLERHAVALCLHDMPGSETERVAIGPFIYVRFHAGAKKYGGAYDDRRLDDWGAWLSRQASKGLEVFAYFNNDSGGHAPRDAVRLRRRIANRLGTQLIEFRRSGDRGTPDARA